MTLSLIFATLVRMPELGTTSPGRKKFRPFRIYSEQEAKSIRRRKRAFVGFVASVVIMVVAAYGYFYYNSFFEHTTDARIATHSSPLLSKVSGKVEKVFVKETQVVKAGDSLLQIDSKEFQSTLAQRERELARSEDQLAGGKVHLNRLQEAKASGNDAAREKYEGAYAWYVRLQTKTRELRESVVEAQTQLKATLITAPSDGHIGKKMADAGTQVTAGQPVIQFVGVGQPWLIANFKAQQLEKMKVGQSASVSVTELGRKFVGKVESIPPRPETQGVKTPLEKFAARFIKGGAVFPVRIEFDTKSVGKDINRLVNDSQAEVKVYIK